MKKKILVIEDDGSVRDSLTELLELAGYEALNAFDGVEGIKSVRISKPDLIICDISMPRMDGYAVINELQKDPSTSLIPFLFLSAKTNLNEIRYGMQLGADDYLFKPFTANDLLQSIETRLEKAQKLNTIKIDLEQQLNKSGTSKSRYSKESIILLMNGSKPESIRVGSVVVIEAEEKYSHVTLENGKKLFVRKLIKEWEEILPEEFFIRIHRSVILNLEYVLKFEKWFNNSYRVYLKNNSLPFEVSRRYASKLKSKFAF